MELDEATNDTINCIKYVVNVSSYRIIDYNKGMYLEYTQLLLFTDTQLD